MSEQAQNNTQQMVMIALVVIAVLLAAIVGILIWQNQSAVPGVSATQQPAATDPNVPAGAMGAAPGGAAGGTSAGAAGAVDPAAVDEKTATKLPEGTEPDAFVKGYYEACATGDWEKAYNSLPADKQNGQTPEGLQQQVEGYGVKSYAVTSAQVDGDKAVVMADQVTASYGTFENQWTFVKKDGAWYVAGKAVTGMK